MTTGTAIYPPYTQPQFQPATATQYYFTSTPAYETDHRLDALDRAIAVLPSGADPNRVITVAGLFFDFLEGQA